MINLIESSVWLCENTRIGGVECTPYSLLILIPLLLLFLVLGFIIGYKRKRWRR